MPSECKELSSTRSTRYHARRMLLLTLAVLFASLSAPHRVWGDALSTEAKLNDQEEEEAGHSASTHSSSLPPATPTSSTTSSTECTSTASSEPVDSAAAAELRAFYELYRPQHLSRVDTILFRYKGNEAAIMPDVRTKYQSEPPLAALVLIVDYLPAVANAVGKSTLLDLLELAWGRLPACAIALLFTGMGLVYATRMHALRQATPISKPSPTMPTPPRGHLATVTGSVSMAVPIAAFIGGVFLSVIVCLVVRNNTTVAAMLLERGLVTIT